MPAVAHASRKTRRDRGGRANLKVSQDGTQVLLVETVFKRCAVKMQIVRQCLIGHNKRVSEEK